MTICPYCKAPLPNIPTLPDMRERWQRIYAAVVEAGPSGISTEDLLVRMYADDEMPTPGGFTVLRVGIHEINKLLRADNQRVINAYRGRYRLVSTEVSHEEAISEEKIHPQTDTPTSHSHSSA